MEDQIKLLQNQIEEINKKYEELEYRVYILFLQSNGVIQQLSESKTIDVDKLIKSMDELNEKLASITEEEGSKLQEVTEGA